MVLDGDWEISFLHVNWAENVVLCCALMTNILLKGKSSVTYPTWLTIIMCETRVNGYVTTPAAYWNETVKILID